MHVQSREGEWDGNKKEKEKMIMKQLKQNDTGNKKTEVYGMRKNQMIELMEKLNKGRKDNIESRRSALNTPVGAIFLSEIIAETC